MILISFQAFPAHIRIEPDTGQQTVQTATDHCRQTAAYAGEALQYAGLRNAAYLAGLIHDFGKFRERFRRYLEAAVESESQALRGTVNHSFAGVRFLLERYHRGTSPWQYYTSELLAFAVGGHHGLFDCVDEQRSSGFRHRLEKDGLDFEETKRGFFDRCLAPAELDRLFDLATEEVRQKLEQLQGLAQQDERWDGEFTFYVGLLARLLLSAVIEGDRRDTAEFMGNFRFPTLPEDMRPIWTKCLRDAERKLSEFPSDTPICRARGRISDQCRAFAERPGGVYRLNVPTGGGKTLSSLRYALAHAAKWNKRRIIFTSPLLSILDQNAKVIRDYVQDDSLILEHHSNVVRTGGEEDRLDQREFLAENWSAPIIITTLVQLLNTLFDGRTTCVRRFHSLCDSVIVIDEVQTVPIHMLTLFDLTVNFLAEICGATVVLCSATQPCLEAAPHPLRIGQGADMVPRDEALWAVFRRTELRNAGSLRMEELPTFVSDKLDRCGSLLVVCNKKSEAAHLYERLRYADANVFHLSASMCMQHRRDTLEAIEASLDSGQKTLCISTQVIEAGVDISFDCAIRLLAGMDSAVQTAGRCNRNGEAGSVMPVYLVQCADEKLGMLRTIEDAKSASVALLSAFDRDEQRFDADLSSDGAVGFYYRKLYANMKGEAQDFPVKGHGTLYELLSVNRESDPEEPEFCLKQAFKTAGRLFRVFDNEQIDVLVPYGSGADLIRELSSERARYDLNYRRTLLDKAKPYTIALFSYQQDRLQSGGGLNPICDGSILTLLPTYYDKSTGFTDQAGEFGYQEV